MFRRRPVTEPVVAVVDDARSRLLAAAREGDDVALAVLRADLGPTALARLAALLAPVAPDAVAVLTAARACADRPEVLEQVVLVLLDGSGRSPAAVAELLGLPLAEVLQARESALARSGLQAQPPGCRGWVLVGRGDALTGPEQEAAEAHVARCRRCAEARAASVQAARRAALPAPRVPAEVPVRR